MRFYSLLFASYDGRNYQGPGDNPEGEWNDMDPAAEFYRMQLEAETELNKQRNHPSPVTSPGND